MKFVSTRGDSPATGLSQAMRHGVAPDGGLYLPESLPRLGALDPAVSLAHWSTAMLAPFFEGDVLAAELPDIC
ncbi:MAG: threonine synthase, partial [Alphaproteobacteria bacterium]|nr:threonine synthase [Alphaproteobacteria bacterium]